MKLGQRLRQLRERAGLSQAGLAREAGLSVRNVQNWEQGPRVPTVFALYKLARALGRAMEDFLEGVTERGRKPKLPRRPRGRTQERREHGGK
jgi:transcriptional regulator with XRE-family HTH domain